VRRILLVLRFDGRRYCGWQVQKNGPSVQAAVQDALERLTGRRPPLTGCGRTDAGVHALRYYAAFTAENLPPCEKLKKALNALLPRDIVVSDARPVPLGFHPRYAAQKKEYVYRLYTSAERDPFLEGLRLHYPHTFDADMLNRAAQAFVGRHDFAGFCSTGGAVKDTVRTVYSLSVRRDEREPRLAEIAVCGDGFLYNMVRIIAGTLLYVAQGRISPDALPGVLASRDRRLAGPTAPAHGLYLCEVWYPNSAFDGV